MAVAPEEGSLAIGEGVAFGLPSAGFPDKGFAGAWFVTGAWIFVGAGIFAPPLPLPHPPSDKANPQRSDADNNALYEGIAERRLVWESVDVVEKGCSKSLPPFMKFRGVFRESS